MSQMPEDPAGASATGDICQECGQELHKPYPDYAKIQALATLSLAEALREVAGQLAGLSHQITLASKR
jgi:hypothetical protein